MVGKCVVAVFGDDEDGILTSEFMELAGIENMQVACSQGHAFNPKSLRMNELMMNMLRL